MADFYDGTPSDLTVLIALTPGNFTDFTDSVDRSTISIRRASPGSPAKFTVLLGIVGGGITFKEEMEVLVEDRSNPAGLYPRYFSGWIKDFTLDVEGSNEERITINCDGKDILFKEPPYQLTTTFKAGYQPWQAAHTFIVGDVIQPNPTNGHRYTCTVAGTSGTAPPTFPTGSGATVTDGTGVTQITWTEAGSAYVTDQTILDQLLTLFFGPTGTNVSWSLGAGILKVNNLINSVTYREWAPGTQIETCLHDIASDAISANYAVTYPNWQANHAYKQGDIIEPDPALSPFPPKGHIYIASPLLFTDGTSGSSQPTFNTVSGSTTVDHNVHWIEYGLIGRWVASTAYFRGQLLSPTTPNGYYYRNITPGTTGATESAWGTTVGANTTQGTAVFVNAGTSSCVPSWQMVMPSDNGAHNATTIPIFTWLDLNNSDGTQVQVLGPIYTDATTFDNTHLHLTKYTLERQSSETFNTVYAFGSNGSAGVAQDSIRITYEAGRIRSTSITNQEWLTNADCASGAADYLAKLSARTTIAGTTVEILDPVAMQHITKGKFRHSLFGLDDTLDAPWPLSDIVLTMPDGLPEYQITAGSGFLSSTDDVLQAQGGGKPFLGDHTPPALVTYDTNPAHPNYWILGNTVDPVSLKAVVQIQWLSGNEADLYQFLGEIQVTGELSRRRFGPVAWPRQDVTISDLPPNTSVTFYIDAQDTSSNRSGLSASPALTTAAIPGPPPAPGISGVTSGAEAANQFYADVVVTHPTGDHSHGGYVTAALHSGPAAPIILVDIPRNAVYPYTARVHGVALGAVYDFKAAVQDQYNQWSTEGSFLNYTITVSPPPAPSITNPITGGFNAHVGYFAAPIVSHPTGDHSHGGFIKVSTPRAPDFLHDIPRDATYPYQPVIGHLLPGIVYTFEAAVSDLYDQWSTLSTARTYTPGHIPKAGDLPEGWGSSSLDDPLRGNVLVVGSVGEVSFADGVTEPAHVPYEGTTSLKLTNGSGGNTALRGPKIWCAPSVIPGTLGAARMRTTGTGTSPDGALKYQYFTEDDVATGAEQTVWDTVPTTSFVYTELPMVAAPSDAKYFRWLVQDYDAGLHGTGFSIYFSYPRFTRQINQAALNAITDPAKVVLWTASGTPREIKDSGGVTRAQEWAQSTPTYTLLGVGGTDFSFSVASGSAALGLSETDDTASLVGRTAVIVATDNVSKVEAIENVGVKVSEAFHLASVVTKTATFTADNHAAIYLCNSASAFTANLPTAVGITGRRYTFNNINTGLVTIDGNGSQTIADLLTYPLPGKCRITIFSDGSNWRIESADGLFSASNAYKSSNQTGIAATTFTKVTWNSEVYDLANEFASDKFTCTIPGYYQVLSTVLVDGGAAVVNDQYMARIYKNGSTIGEGRNFCTGTGNYTLTTILIPIISLAATDTLEVYFWHNPAGGGTRDIYGSGSAETAFGVSKVS